jgi:predicted porin
MKKAILTFAVLSVFAAAASAQSNVTVYGIIDVGVTRDDNGAPAGASLRMDSGNLYGSRIGFKGSEDLGGGLSANFNLENGFSLDTGSMVSANTLFNRQAWVGLKGNFGSVRLGRMWDPYYVVLFNTVDPFGDGLVGGASRLMGGGGFRMSNAIDYQTPELGGFYGELGYGLGEVAGDTSANRLWTMKAGYAAGPVDVVAAYYNQNKSVATGGATKNTLLGASYDFGAVKVRVGYDMLKGDTTAAGTVLDQRDLLVGANVAVGIGSVLVSYIRKTDKLVANADSRQIAVGYTHPLSKRTLLYTAYSRTSNDGSARYNLDASAPAGASDSAIQFGINHLF